MEKSVFALAEVFLKNRYAVKIGTDGACWAMSSLIKNLIKKIWK